MLRIYNFAETKLKTIFRQKHTNDFYAIESERLLANRNLRKYKLIRRKNKDRDLVNARIAALSYNRVF